MDFYKNYSGSIDNRNQRGWARLPSDILTSIFDRLPAKNKYRASMACTTWYQAFKSENSWRTLRYNERAFTRKKFTMHAGWQSTTDHFRLKIFTSNKASSIRTLYLQPDTLLFNFYEFLRVLTNFSEFYENVRHNPLGKMKEVFVDWNLKYNKDNQESTNASNIAPQDKVAQMPTLYGTGGRVLNQLDYFMSHLTSLQTLSLSNLLLSDAEEIERFMQHLLNYFSDSLKCLKIVNLSKRSFPLLHVGFLGNLRRLIITVQHLNDDSLLLLGQCPFLEHLIIAQDENTVGHFDIDRKTWLIFADIKPRVEVHLVCTGLCKQNMVFQRAAPVYSIIFKNAAHQLQEKDVYTIVDNYSKTLTSFIQKGMARKFRSKTFDQRIDACLIHLLKNCPILTTCAIREHFSFGTLVKIGQILQNSCNDARIFVRKNAILKRNDWAKEDFDYCRSRFNSNSFETILESFCKEFPNIRILNDKEYLDYFPNKSQ